jgi:hypothetical protein
LRLTCQNPFDCNLLRLVMSPPSMNQVHQSIKVHKCVFLYSRHLCLILSLWPTGTPQFGGTCDHPVFGHVGKKWQFSSGGKTALEF